MLVSTIFDTQILLVSTSFDTQEIFFRAPFFPDNQKRKNQPHVVAPKKCPDSTQIQP